MKIEPLIRAIPVLAGILLLILYLPLFIPVTMSYPVAMAFGFILFVAITGLTLLFKYYKRPEDWTRADLWRSFLQRVLTIGVPVLAVAVLSYYLDAILVRPGSQSPVPSGAYLTFFLLIAAAVISYLCLLRITHRQWLLLPPSVSQAVMDFGARFPGHLRIALVYNAVVLVLFAVIGLRLVPVDLGLFFGFFFLLAFGVGNLVIVTIAYVRSEIAKEQDKTP